MALPTSISQLTTGQVAGLIALGVFVVQIFLSFAWSLILVALLNDSETAVTWSVVSRVLHISYWPAALRTDAVASKGVRSPVTAVSWISSLTAFVVSIAAVVTPLGLYDAVTQSSNPSMVPFQYVKDTSPFGGGTAKRPSLGFSRICIMGERACPNDANLHYNITYYTEKLTNGTYQYNRFDNMTTYDTRIPRRLSDYFSSGLSKLGHTVSGPFDIQWRTWRVMNNTYHEYYNNNTGFVIGEYQHLSSILLNDAFEAVEGLVVDSKSGRIGFRNHSVPASDLPNGAVWTEDLLFLEPVTKCCNLDLTLDYTLNDTRLSKFSLVDHGGFVNIDRSTPYWQGFDDQQDPRLADRAYMAAWKTKMLTMFMLNVTNTRNGSDKLLDPPFSYLNSRIGDKFNLPDQDSLGIASDVISYNALGTQLYGDWLEDTLTPWLIDESNIPLNPWKVAVEDFLPINNECHRSKFENSTDARIVAGRCGLVLGIPQPRDESPSVMFEKGSQWSIPMYSCASANRAVIKTVRFGFNSSGSFKGLKVLDVEPKQYDSALEHPLWALETSSGSPDGRWTLMRWAPLWGIVGTEDSSFNNLTYKRSPELWLSGETDLIGTGSQGYNLPAADAPRSFLADAYGVNSRRDNTSPLADYSGRKNAPLYDLWKNLSQTAEDTERIINLIWTDVATNALAGTCGHMPSSEPQNLAKREASTNIHTEVRVPVYVINRTTKYHLPYAVPALLVLAMVAIALAASVVSLLLGRGTVSKVKFFLSRLSTGRVMTAFLGIDGEPEEASSVISGSSRARWLNRGGRTVVDVSGSVPRARGRGKEKAGRAMLDKLSFNNDFRVTNPA